MVPFFGIISFWIFEKISIPTTSDIGSGELSFMSNRAFALLFENSMVYSSLVTINAA